jgi:multiple sugar transport system substrate-binding protein
MGVGTDMNRPTVSHPRLSRRLSILLLLGLVVFATGLPPGARAADGAHRITTDQPVTLQFMGTGTDTGWRPVFAGYEKLHPNVKIQFQGVPFVDYQNTLVQRFASGGSSIDVFMVDPTYIPLFTERGYLLDLTDPFSSKMAGVLNKNDIDGATYKGRLRTMPIWDSTQILFYNRDLLSKAGIQPPGHAPTDRWTWDRTIQAAQKARQAGAKYGFDFEQVDRYYQLQPLPESLGGGPGVTGKNLLTVDITNPAWQKAAGWYASIYRTGAAPKSLPNGAATTAAFAAGQLAFIVAGPWNIPTFNAARGLHYGYAPQPYFAGGKPVTPSESWHWGISTNSSHRQVALDLLAYAGLTTKGSLQTAATFPLPANLEAAKSALVQQLAASNPAMRGVDTLIRYESRHTAVRRPRSLGYLQLEEFVSRAWSDIRDGVNPRTVLTRTQAQLASSFTRIQPPSQ